MDKLIPEKTKRRKFTVSGIKNRKIFLKKLYVRAKLQI